MNPIEILHQKIEDANLWDGRYRVERNGFLKHPGTIENKLYYVVSGSLKVFIQQDDEHIIRFGYKNNFITALDSFITERPSHMCIQAIKATEVKVISKHKYLDFIEQDQENQKLWDMLLQAVIVQQIEREIDLLTASPKERYRRVFMRSPQLFQEIPNKHIASYLRMTPETLSRLKSLDLNQ